MSLRKHRRHRWARGHVPPTRAVKVDGAGQDRPEHDIVQNHGCKQFAVEVVKRRETCSRADKLPARALFFQPKRSSGSHRSFRRPLMPRLDVYPFLRRPGSKFARRLPVRPTVFANLRRSGSGRDCALGLRQHREGAADPSQACLRQWSGIRDVWFHLSSAWPLR